MPATATVASLILHPARERLARASAVQHAIDQLRGLPLPTSAARALQACGIHTLADLTVRVPRRHRWWTVVPGLGATAARHIEAFFAAHPALTARARALVVVDTAQDVVPCELLQVPEDVDGSQGRFRAPPATCTLRAHNDFEAVQAWLSLHEAPATQRASRKEAERLMLWAVLERGKGLSALTTEDAIAYRALLRRPTQERRWVGPSRPRTASDWKPFTGGLSACSTAYGMSVLGTCSAGWPSSVTPWPTPLRGSKCAAPRVWRRPRWSGCSAKANGSSSWPSRAAWSPSMARSALDLT